MGLEGSTLHQQYRIVQAAALPEGQQEMGRTRVGPLGRRAGGAGRGRVLMTRLLLLCVPHFNFMSAGGGGGAAGWVEVPPLQAHHHL